MTGWIEDTAALEQLYGDPVEAATVKVADRLTPEYRAWIQAAPFCALATAGPDGLDCPPRGDDGPVVHIVDDRTLALPDRRGNNRIDSLRNIVRDPRVSLMLLIPGAGTVIRVNGTGRITAEPGWLERFATRGQLPRTVLVLSVAEVYFQCARAVLRSRLWDGGIADPEALPSPGRILEAMSGAAIDGAAYDAYWPSRAARTMW